MCCFPSFVSASSYPIVCASLSDYVRRQIVFSVRCHDEAFKFRRNLNPSVKGFNPIGISSITSRHHHDLIPSYNPNPVTHICFEATVFFHIFQMISPTIISYSSERGIIRNPFVVSVIEQGKPQQMENHA